MQTGPPDRSFPRTCRLVSSADYRRIYRYRWRGHSGPFTWHASPNPRRHARLGLAIPKRVVKRSTARSRIKRLVRESFRNNRARLPCVDIIVSVKQQPADLHDPRLHRALDMIWQDIVSNPPDARCP